MALTIADVARAAGVSPSAVSFALNDRPGVSASTRARILEVAEQLGWSPNTRARSLSTSRAFAIALVIARPARLLAADPFFPAFIAGVEAELEPRGQALLLQVVSDPRSEAERYRRLAREGRADGVLLTDLRVDDPRPALVQQLALPAVALATRAGGVPLPRDLPAVALDDGPGIEAAVAHLAALGHRRIAHVAGPQHLAHGRNRASAWRQALEVAGLPGDDPVEADFSAASGARATRELLDRRQPPTAIVYANDVMALAGAAVAAERGLDVPGDLSVTGFDDTETAAHAYPPLTSIRSDPELWGRTATRVLLDLVDTRASGVPRPAPSDVVLPPARLVLRGSCAPPRPA